MSGFGGMDMWTKALETAQKQADSMLGIDATSASQAMADSAGEGQMFKTVAGDATKKLSGAAKSVAGRVEGFAKKTPVKAPTSDSDFFSTFATDFDTPSRKRDGDAEGASVSAAASEPSSTPKTSETPAESAPTKSPPKDTSPAAGSPEPDTPADAAPEPAAEQSGAEEWSVSDSLGAATSASGKGRPGEAAAGTPAAASPAGLGELLLDDAWGDAAGEGSATATPTPQRGDAAPLSPSPEEPAAWLAALPGPPGAAGDVTHASSPGAGQETPSGGAEVAAAPKAPRGSTGGLREEAPPKAPRRGEVGGNAAGAAGGRGGGAGEMAQMREALARKGVQLQVSPRETFPSKSTFY